MVCKKEPLKGKWDRELRRRGQDRSVHSSPGSNKKPQLAWTWQMLMISISIELVDVFTNHINIGLHSI